jgi:uncharacterized protein YxeA
MNEIVKKVFRIILILLIFVTAVLVAFLAFDYIRCHTYMRCESRPTLAEQKEQLGMQWQYVQIDISAGRYDVAKQRLEYILANNPNYPGATEKLAEVEKFITITPTP